ncbi:hypothetical protein ACOSQ3_011640 [Xanthoceras sorbifolium]
MSINLLISWGDEVDAPLSLLGKIYGVHGAPELVQGNNAKVKKPYEQRQVLGLDMFKEYVRLAVSNLENTIALPLWLQLSKPNYHCKSLSGEYIIHDTIHKSHNRLIIDI